MASEPGRWGERLVFKPAADSARSIDPAIVEQAVAWLVKIQSGSASVREAEACDLWRRAHPDHERAWLRLSGLGRDLREGTGAVPAQIVRSTLRGADHQQRRCALKAVAGLGVGAVTAWTLRHDIAALSADHRTVAGERRQVVLADGTLVFLNTRTAIDVRIDATSRTLRLQGGEIMVTTARDAAGRPFVVLGRDGRLVPVGTRFVVRAFDDADGSRSELTVLEGAVDLQAGAGEGAQVVRVPAGCRVGYGASGVGALTSPGEGAAAWTDGSLVVERMRLAEFLAELGRYRPGVLRCDRAVSEVLVSGAFPLADTDAVLRMLEETLPVRVRSLSRYWVTVASR
ncbi:FecR family protein [Variovorax sp. 54]|uniref:FecR domain-containing protein n=1 Tax=Variovorax sp. 54 TaxID=2035212 RepID=UPI000C193BDD|nr:FecR domain-containing protein [Variovorax sp. 54]PIF77707.1 FecR family protein [Variovorax sp. 54]